MKKGVRFSLFALCFSVTLFAKEPLPVRPHPIDNIPISFVEVNKTTPLYLPSSCSGFINDAVAGEGALSLSVQGRILNGQLLVQVKVDYRGSAITTVGNNAFSIDGNLSASENITMAAGPVDVFVKGQLKLVSKNKSATLYLADLGFVTVYPDGTVVNHILDPQNDPEYSKPKIYCSTPPAN